MYDCFYILLGIFSEVVSIVSPSKQASSKQAMRKVYLAHTFVSFTYEINTHHRLPAAVVIVVAMVEKFILPMMHIMT
jgi:hypothetical protein